MLGQGMGVIIDNQDAAGATGLVFAAQDDHVSVEFVVTRLPHRLLGFYHLYREPVAGQSSRKTVIMRR